MKMLSSVVMGLLIVVGGGLAAIALFFFWASSGRLPADDYARIEAVTEFPLSTNEAELTVISYNIGYLSGLTNNEAVRPTADFYDQNLQTVIAALGPLQPDILALQEIDLDSRRSFHVNQVAALGSALQMPQRAIAINWDKRYVPFPYWPPQVQFGQILSGQAVLSRWPITQHERLVLERVPTNPFYYNALYLDRLAQVATLDVNGRSLVVINLHLEAFDGPTRQRQTEFVLALAETYAETMPVLLLGDFNSAINRAAEGEPHSIQTVANSSVFRPVIPPEQWPQSGQATYPADTPQYKLDYIFYTPDSLELLAAEVVTMAGSASDHLPLLMRVRLR